MLAFVVWFVVAVNLLTFLVWGFDKRRARVGGWRVPEAHLLLLCALTGCIGAWGGVSVFRHKTQKTSFRFKLWLATLFNLLWLWLAWQS